MTTRTSILPKNPIHVTLKTGFPSTRLAFSAKLLTVNEIYQLNNNILMITSLLLLYFRTPLRFERPARLWAGHGRCHGLTCPILLISYPLEMNHRCMEAEEHIILPLRHRTLESSGDGRCDLSRYNTNGSEEHTVAMDRAKRYAIHTPNRGLTLSHVGD